MRPTDDGDDALGLRGDTRQRLLTAAQEARPHQQVFRRIAADGQFRKQHHVGAVFVTRLMHQLDDTAGVAGHVPDREIELGQGDA